MRRLTLRACILLVLSPTLACEDEPPPPPPPTGAVKKADAPKPVDRQKVAMPDAGYVYSSVGKRDPFRPYYADFDAEEAAKRAEQNLTELQRFEVDQLKLVAILSGTSQPTAMFEDPKGLGWPVLIGTPIGRNNGRVTKIKKDEVVITEEYRDAAGKKVVNNLSVRLPGDELVMEKQ